MYKFSSHSQNTIFFTAIFDVYFFKFINFFRVQSFSRPCYHLRTHWITEMKILHSIFHLSLHLMFCWWILFALFLSLVNSCAFAFSIHSISLNFSFVIVLPRTIFFHFVCTSNSWSLFSACYRFFLNKKLNPVFLVHFIWFVDSNIKCVLLLDCIMFTL